MCFIAVAFIVKTLVGFEIENYEPSTSFSKGSFFIDNFNTILVCSAFILGTILCRLLFLAILSRSFNAGNLAKTVLLPFSFTFLEKLTFNIDGKIEEEHLNE